MRSRLTALALALASLLGMCLQRWAIKTAYDPVTRLVLPGEVALTALKVFAFAVPVLALLGALGLKGKKLPGGRGLYRGTGLPCCLWLVSAGVLTVLGGGLSLAVDGRLFWLRRGGTLLAACGVDLLLAAGGVCMMWLAIAGRRNRLGDRPLAALIPGFAGCFWLIFFYHSHSRDPVVTHYCWILLALMASILAFYHQAGYSFGRPHPVRAQACTLTAGAYAFTAMLSAEDLFDVLLLAGLGFWMLAHCVLLAGAGETAPDGASPGERTAQN